MTLFTYNTPRPRPDFPISPDPMGDPVELPKPLPEEEPEEWGEPIMVVDDDTAQPRGDDDPADPPQEEEGPEVAVDEDKVPPARGPESEPP